MRSSAEELAKVLLRQDEGLRLKPYIDTNRRLTIGYGRNLTDRGITMGEAESFLDHDVMTAVDELRARWAWFDNVGLVRQAALIDLHYNLGLPRLAEFRQFLAAMEVEDYDAAAQELLDSNAARAAPLRYNRLANMVQRGVWRLGMKETE